MRDKVKRLFIRLGYGPFHGTFLWDTDASGKYGFQEKG